MKENDFPWVTFGYLNLDLKSMDLIFFFLNSKSINFKFIEMISKIPRGLDVISNPRISRYKILAGFSQIQIFLFKHTNDIKRNIFFHGISN